LIKPLKSLIKKGGGADYLACKAHVQAPCRREVAGACAALWYGEAFSMEAAPSPTQTREPKSRSGAGRWIAAILLIMGIVVALVAIGIFKTASPILSMIKSIPEMAARFQTGTITTTFKESIPVVTSTQGDVLELATARSDELFHREDTKTIFWNTLFLGTTVSEIRVPVTFRYHVRLSDPWRLAARGNVCLVLAPRVRPSQPPAIHTDLMEKMTENGWARFNKDDNLSALEKSITPTLEMRAFAPRQMQLSRDACRQSVAEFVKKWLMKEDRWRLDRFSSIVVVFPDEGRFDSDDQLEKLQREPSVELRTPRD
jgi:hypothetical protein